ncbi:Rieske (2Fe-2S) protein [uncultured Pigmentiphaga sp.]|jgi:Ferredoxin subunits of nitrite reductase and ring-hydroxylating dioxygenases|uniref:Rieske (2Fe-2S) protein n=1 Tax=uncultured Pigmentiphaga sp. TaxID=340361 RepID=UPI0026269651|nr:Rieske (2Fe-2S) protein [uncultured Pigmentiphaga sp.]
MGQHYICRSDELREGERRIVEVGGRTYGIFRIDGQLRAYLNECPHQGGPVCEGLLIHKVVEVLDDQRRHIADTFDTNSLNIVCAYHGWEFDIRTGLSSDDGLFRLRRIKAFEEDGKIYFSPLEK